MAAILRREGLYSSALTDWRRQRDAAGRTLMPASLLAPVLPFLGRIRRLVAVCLVVTASVTANAQELRIGFSGQAGCLSWTASWRRRTRDRTLSSPI